MSTTTRTSPPVAPKKRAFHFPSTFTELFGVTIVVWTVGAAVTSEATGIEYPA